MRLCETCKIWDSPEIRPPGEEFVHHVAGFVCTACARRICRTMCSYQVGEGTIVCVHCFHSLDAQRWPNLIPGKEIAPKIRVPFNMGMTAHAKLTPSGIAKMETLREGGDACVELIKPSYEREHYEAPLWVFARCFGPYFDPQGDIAFDEFKLEVPL